MNWLDWSVMLGTLAFIVIYGIIKTRGQKNLEGYLRGDSAMPWWTIGLSVMATQASAITFMSTPGQAFDDGMRFVQFYFGLPIAMVIICIVFLPKYYKLKVYTAYEFLESRFDQKTRTLASLLFLTQRGLAAGITIYAPSIILSTILGWDLTLTTLIIGVVVIIYTVSGGTKAVSQTQKLQFTVIMMGMFIVFGLILSMLPENIGFSDSMKIAGKMGKMNIVDWSFNFKDRYNIWSGLTGGLFLALSYFGTDQSQVARYISGASLTESRLGLLFNGLLKIPMQFFILLCGIMVFVFYQFTPAPVFFNETTYKKAVQTEYVGELKIQENRYQENFQEKSVAIQSLVKGMKANDEVQIENSTSRINSIQAEEKEIRTEVKAVIKKALPDSETKDTDYVFLGFVLHYLPHGIIGLLLAVIVCAAMSSTSSEINALASTTVIDLYKRNVRSEKSQSHYVFASKGFTIVWGAVVIAFAVFASLFDNLIQAVNILGSLFYGTILGIFLTAFYLKKVGSTAVFISAIIAEAAVVTMFFNLDIGFLWYNLIGCGLVMILSVIFSVVMPRKTPVNGDNT